jgi:DNA-binding MarR family transcriptional regulator
MGREGDGRAVAERLHGAAIRLIRRLRKSDVASGLAAPKLSALSVLVFGGPHTVKELAAAEQVRAPTMSRLLAELEGAGLVQKSKDPEDRRIVRVQATTRGRNLLEAGKSRRLEVLAAQIRSLDVHERRLISTAVKVIERLNGQK